MCSTLKTMYAITIDGLHTDRIPDQLLGQVTKGRVLMTSIVALLTTYMCGVYL